MKEIKKAVINLKNKIERMAESIDSDVEKIIMLIEKKEMENEKPLCGENRKTVVQTDKRHVGELGQFSTIIEKRNRSMGILL